MAYLNETGATKAAVEIITAAAQSGALKLLGSPSNTTNAAAYGAADAQYLATLVNGLAKALEHQG
jgi:hypothetical protein